MDEHVPVSSSGGADILVCLGERYSASQQSGTGMSRMTDKNVCPTKLTHYWKELRSLLVHFIRPTRDFGRASPRTRWDRDVGCRRASEIGRPLRCRNRAPWDR